MDEIIMGFEYNLYNNDLTEQIDTFIYKNLYNDENNKMKLKEIHSPINTGKIIIKNNKEYIIYHVLISFINQPMTDAEIMENKEKKEKDWEIHENKMDDQYHFVIRKESLYSDKLILKIEGHLIESINLFEIFSFSNDKIKVIRDVNEFLGDRQNLIYFLKSIFVNHNYNKEISEREISQWINEKFDDHGDFGSIRLFLKNTSVIY